MDITLQALEVITQGVCNQVSPFLRNPPVQLPRMRYHEQSGIRHVIGPRSKAQGCQTSSTLFSSRLSITVRPGPGESLATGRSVISFGDRTSF